MVASATVLATPNTTNFNLPSSEDSWNKGVETEIKARLNALNLPIALGAEDQVMTRIRQYLINGKRETEAILGRTTVYFPIFEHYLELYGLPDELKYLPIIESGLRPTVKSGVGAAGMWQLMAVTAQHFNLEVDGQVDERFDPYKSTEAAVKMLKYLHDMFGDWALVLAAYNSGPGKVQKAVRYAGTNDYWTVKAYLPDETQRYVPAYLAAAYVANFYHEHDITPRLPDFAAEETRALRVFQPLSFSKIAKVTGLDYATIAKLNPSFVTGYIPASRDGHLLVLPASATKAARSLLHPEGAPSADNLVPTVYVAAKGDTLARVADLFQTTPEKIREWNRLGASALTVNQELILYLSKAYLINRA